MSIDQRLAELGIELPQPAAPVASYVPAVEHGGLLHISGQISFAEDGSLIKGRLGEDMDIDAGRILEGAATLDEVGDEIFRSVVAVSAGAATKSEALGHQEFILTYKQFEPIGPACMPSVK